MLGCNLLKIVGMTVLLFLNAIEIAIAQGDNVATVGEFSKLRVAEQSGSSYLWKIYSDKSMLNQVYSSDAEFVGVNTGSEVIVKWNKSGEYYFTVNSINSSGCSNLKIGKMEVLNWRLVANAGADATIGSCQKLKLDGSGSQGDIIQYEWSMIETGGAIVNQGNKIAEFSLSPLYAGELPAKFQIELVVTDKFGNSNRDTITVEVDKRPKAKIVLADLADKNDYLILNGSNSLGTKISFLWYTSNGTIVGGNDQQVVIVKIPGMYGLLVNDVYGCESTISQKVTDSRGILIAKSDYGRCSWADELIIPVLNNDFSSDSMLMAKTVMIIKNPIFGNATVINGKTVKYVPSVNHSCRDKFEYKVFDEFSLCDSAEVIIDVFDAPLTRPYGFSPNGDGINELLIFQGLKNYPNSKLIVLNINGQVIYKSENYQNNWDGKISVHGLGNLTNIATGTYYYVLKLGGGDRTLKGFIYIVN
jgi:gliding motility-associated-like protein